MVYQGSRKRPRVCEANMNARVFYHPPNWRILCKGFHGRFAGCCMDDEDRYHIVMGDSRDAVRDSMKESFGEEHASGAHIFGGRIPRHGVEPVYSIY